MLKHILMLYGLPLVLLVGSILLFNFILSNNINKDVISAVLGLASLIVSFSFWKLYDKREMKNNPIKYTVAKNCNKE